MERMSQRKNQEGCRQTDGETGSFDVGHQNHPWYGGQEEVGRGRKEEKTQPKVIYRINAIPIKILMTLFRDLGKSVLNFIWRIRRPRLAKAMRSNKNHAGGNIIPDFKLYYRTKTTHAHTHTHTQNRHTNQCIRRYRNKSTHLKSADL